MIAKVLDIAASSSWEERVCRGSRGKAQDDSFLVRSAIELARECKRLQQEHADDHALVGRLNLSNVGLERARDSWRKRCLRSERVAALQQDAADNFLVPIAKDALLQLSDLRARLEAAERERNQAKEMLKSVEQYLRDLACDGCEYGDGCPTFGTRHLECRSCKLLRMAERIAALGEQK